MFGKILPLLLALVLFQVSASAQYNNPRGRVSEALIGLSAGGKVGTTVYFGDLVDGGRVRWTCAGFLEKQKLPWLSIRLELDAGQCKGGQKDGNGNMTVEFMTTFFSADLFGKVNFLDLLTSYDDARPFNPYFGVGGGIRLFSCKKNPAEGNEDYGKKLIEKFGEDYPYADWLHYQKGTEFAPEVSGILGVRYAVSSKLWIFAEARGDLLFTDYFDGHQGYPTPSAEDPEAWYDSDHKFDALWTVSLGAQYRFLNFNHWTNTSSKYSRKAYLRNKKSYVRNANRIRRR